MKHPRALERALRHESWRMCNAMQIRVVVRWKPVRMNDSFHKMCNAFVHLPCLLGRHEEELEVGNGKLAVKCARCGWKSPGFTVGARTTAAELGNVLLKDRLPGPPLTRSTQPDRA